MSMFAPLLATDPAAPRLTFYDDARGIRMDFSGQTLDNWANKVANMLDEEFEPGEILIDLPVSWQAAVIALGAFNASRTPLIDASLPTTPAPHPAPDVVFTTLERTPLWQAADSTPEVAVVSDDPFGRGVVEAGGKLPVGAVDFGPTVRFYGDQYFGDSPSISEFAGSELGHERYLVPAFTDTESFVDSVLAPIASGGSVVLVAGLVSADRLQDIAAAEKVTQTLEA